VSELGVDVRDALAGLDHTHLSQVIADWVQTEALRDLGVTDTGALRPVIEKLLQLARQAREADEKLYCWTCL
jgi:hypothetical protein